MKHKTLKRVLCFLLALVVVASMPLDIHANAVAVAPWAVYALITYMAAVGITFTVTGGVDAMVKAVQDKVDEYEKTVSLPLPIWVVIEEGTKLVPPPSGGGPNWNPNRGKFFFTANATAAITAFITWLVSDGGWTKDEQVQENLSQYSFACIYNSQPAIFKTYSIISEQLETAPKAYEISQAGDYIPFKSDWVYGNSYFYYPYFDSSGVKKYGWFIGYEDNRITYFYNKSSLTASNYSSNSSFYISDVNSLGYSVDDILGIGFVRDYPNQNTSTANSLLWGYVTNDNKFLLMSAFAPYFTTIDDTIQLIQSDLTVEVPEEIPQLQPSTQQGVYIDTSTDAETLEELAEDIKTQFEETGTIPRPVPEVITDPDVVPQPSPVPTPPVYEDVDGLGLPSLAETMKNKFPFCLPYDLGRVFDIFYAEPVAPYWEVDLFATLGNRVPFVGDTSFTIDLTEYEDLGMISRWMTTIGYTLLLILITRQTIKW